MMGADRGAITAEYFDTGVSRRLPWNARQQASRLLKALAQPNRPFDAIVVGEFERAFYADQYTLLVPVFAAHGVQVWLPELDGPVDPASEAHLSLLALLGAHSRREVQRARFRAKAAMRAQVQIRGRRTKGHKESSRSAVPSRRRRRLLAARITQHFPTR